MWRPRMRGGGEKGRILFIVCRAEKSAAAASVRFRNLSKQQHTWQYFITAVSMCPVVHFTRVSFGESSVLNYNTLDFPHSLLCHQLIQSGFATATAAGIKFNLNWQLWARDQEKGLKNFRDEEEEGGEKVAQTRRRNCKLSFHRVNLAIRTLAYIPVRSSSQSSRRRWDFSHIPPDVIKWAKNAARKCADLGLLRLEGLILFTT